MAPCVFLTEVIWSVSRTSNIEFKLYDVDRQLCLFKKKKIYVQRDIPLFGTLVVMEKSTGVT
jgi:hypothetical protein